jgi:hypothetical protein
MTVSVKAPTSTTGSIQLNGSDVLTIDSSGNLTAPNNLTVTGTVSSTGNVAFDTDTLYVDATNNNVGIGTTTPTNFGSNFKMLAVQGSDYGVVQAVSTNGSATAELMCSPSYGFIGTRTNHPFILRVNDTERMRIDSGTGSVRIGSNNAYGLNEKLMIYGSSTANQPTIISSKEASGTVSSNHFLFQNTNGTVGSVATSGSATSYNTSSDYRLKENVAPMSGSIDRLKKLKPSTWSWTQDGSHGEGFIAHEAQTVIPEAVTGTKDAMRTEEYEVTPAVLDEDGNVVTEAVMGTREVPDYQGIDQSKLVPLLTAALQEAITKIEDLETRIQTLESA